MTATPPRMLAVQLVGHGDFDQLVINPDAPTPSPKPREVLIKVAAAGVNNTDINTRIGWYSKSVTGATDQAQATGDDGAWSDPIAFPRIQGADCCGHIVAVGAGVATSRIGQRVIVRTMQRPIDDSPPPACTVFGSEFDGAFAEYTVARADEVYAVDSTWSDVELAAVPCAWSTAEAMLERADVGAERVLVTGASGGVGSSAVQLANRRGAEVIAVAGAAKADALLSLGASEVIDRNADLQSAVASDSIDVVVDLVAGPSWSALPGRLRPGGRYVAAGAIAGPLVTLDVRDLYLKDLTLLGSTWQPPKVFENLVGYIERDEVRPLVAATYPLGEIVTAQRRFLTKDFVGKIVLTVSEGHAAQQSPM